MTFTKSLCSRCFIKKYRGRSFTAYLKDLEPDDEELCEDCGAKAEVQVEINPDIDAKVSGGLNVWHSLVDLTTFSERDIDTLGAYGEVGRKKKAEIYLDLVARNAQKTYDKLKNKFSWLTIDDLFLIILEQTILHELLHRYRVTDERFVTKVFKWIREVDREIAEEEETRRITLKLMELKPPQSNSMVWSCVPCPKSGKDIQINECIQCRDDQKDPSCPIQAIRNEFKVRSYRPNVYHVTEITHPRKAYFERFIDYTSTYRQNMALWWGKAAHRSIQSKYPEHWCEIYCEKDFGEFKIVGSIDVIDQMLWILFEVKSYKVLVFKADRPDEFHKFQAKAYVELLQATDPNLARQLKKLRIICIAKLTDGAPYREFDLPPEPPSDLKERGEALHQGFKTNTPPDSKWCPNWLCDLCHPKIIAACGEYHGKYHPKGWRGEK